MGTCSPILLKGSLQVWEQVKQFTIYPLVFKTCVMRTSCLTEVKINHVDKNYIAELNKQASTFHEKY